MISRDIDWVQSINQQTLLRRMFAMDVGMIEVPEVRESDDLFSETAPSSNAQQQSAWRIHAEHWSLVKG